MKVSDKKVFKLHAELCKTLANPTRLEVLSLLRDGKKSVGELTVLTGVRQATISQHLAVLRNRSVVSAKREGANVYYEVANPKITKACDIIREVLFDHINNMKELYEKEEAKVVA